MPENLPELAIDNDFSSEALEPDDRGIYTIVNYYRHDQTLYMKSTLSHDLGNGLYKLVTLTYYDATGKKPLHQVVWELEYDINRKIVAKKVR